MCGIFGIITSNPTSIFYNVLDGLTHLENRGYDSSGISIIYNNSFITFKHINDDKTPLEKLRNESCNIVSVNGIGHNRWATHGAVNIKNAHPHLSNNKKLSIIHNGIIDNYEELKQFLLIHNFTLYSDTDTEVIINLIQHFSTKNILYDAVCNALEMIKGTYSCILQNVLEPGKLYYFKKGMPMIVGFGKNSIYGKYIICTSELSAFDATINYYCSINDDDVGTITNATINTHNIYNCSKFTYVSRDLNILQYKHWINLEIHEQSNVVNTIIDTYCSKSDYDIYTINIPLNNLLSKTNIIILGCGSSYFAGLYGATFFKKIPHIKNVNVYEGPEFTENDIKNEKTLVILISQSGETKDLHNGLSIIKNMRLPTIGIINVENSFIANQVDLPIYCKAGIETSVASTKSITAQIIILYLLSLKFSNLLLTEDKIKDLLNLPSDINKVLSLCNPEVEMLSDKLYEYNNMFIMGKFNDEIIAKEISLKIKEICYIHCEAYSISSLKHGPFALLTESFPVLIISNNKYNDKVNIIYEEIKARKAPVFIIDVSKYAYNNTFNELLNLYMLQLLAYNISIKREINPDKPKNLAKVVTVY